MFGSPSYAICKVWLIMRNLIFNVCDLVQRCGKIGRVVIPNTIPGHHSFCLLLPENCKNLKQLKKNTVKSDIWHFHFVAVFMYVQPTICLPSLLKVWIFWVKTWIRIAEAAFLLTCCWLPDKTAESQFIPGCSNKWIPYTFNPINVWKREECHAIKYAFELFLRQKYHRRTPPPAHTWARIDEPAATQKHVWPACYLWTRSMPLLIILWIINYQWWEDQCHLFTSCNISRLSV